MMSAAQAPLLAINGTPLVGVVGWKNSGKTTLVTGLIAELTARGLAIASVKHAHHAFDADKPGTDSYRHRQAGARQVALVGGARWALFSELGDGVAEPPFEAIAALFAPADLMVVEGYKSLPIRKIEARRTASIRRDPIDAFDPHVVAIAADHPVVGAGKPVFDINDIRGLADFIEAVILGRVEVARG